MSYKINYSTEEKIKLAKDDSVEKLYESKKNQRTVRVLTVLAYILTVSLAAIILSAYYVFLWNPTDASAKNPENPNTKCEKIIIPENLAIRLANNSEVSAETFFNEIIKQLHKIQNDAQESLPDDHPKLNRTGFNHYLKFISTKIQRDAPGDKKARKKNKKYQDDEDFNLDLESSGDKMSDKMSVTTVYPTPTPDPSSDMNDTTIIFDQEQEE